MRRSLLVALAGAAVASAVAGVVYGAPAARSVAQILVPLGLVAVAAAHLVAHSAWSLRRRLAAIGVIVGAQLAVGVALFTDLMFVSPHDAFFTVTLAGFTGLIGLWAGGLAGRRAVDDLERAIERARTEERARRDLVAAVSHDLRTPITSLRLLAEAVEDGIVDEPARRDYLRRMTTHVRQLGALIEDLFELSRLEAGDLRWSMEQVTLDALVAETVDAMRPHAEAGRVAVEADVPGRAVARANPEQLQRVLFNLIQNAIRHTPADGSVTVRAGNGGGHVQVEVVDTGAGIAPDDRARVFEPFTQGADRVARTDGSAGLGLAIARAIVEAHGGRIWLADVPAGTSVRFTLPAA